MSKDFWPFTYFFLVNPDNFINFNRNIPEKNKPAHKILRSMQNFITALPPPQTYDFLKLLNLLDNK